MSKLPLYMALPLMTGKELVSAVLSTEDLLGYGAVVAPTSNGYELLTNDSLVDVVVNAAGGPMPTLAQVTGHSIAQPARHQFDYRNFDFLNPDPAAIAEICRDVNSTLLAGPVVSVGSDRTMITLYRDPNFNFELSRRIYICSIFGESYNEGTYVKWRGKCPKHAGAVLN